MGQVRPARLRVVLRDVNMDIRVYKWNGERFEQLDVMKRGYENNKLYEEYWLGWNEDYYVVEVGDHVVVDKVRCVKSDFIDRWIGKVRCVNGRSVKNTVLIAHDVFAELVKRLL